MSKRHLMVDAETTTPKRVSITSKINWNLCVLCQENGTGLQCPYAFKSNQASVGSGYKTLAEQLVKFSELGHMPINVDIKQLDEGDGIEATMMRNHAGWHKICRIKFNQTKLDRLQKRTKEKTSSSVVHTRSSHDCIDLKDDKCFLCEGLAGTEGLHNASTYDVDAKVRRCAIVLEDTALLAKLEPGDMIALEAKYHRRCLVNLYNRARALEPTISDRSCDAHLHGIAFAELVAFMEDFRKEDIAPVFKLADLALMYKMRLEQLGVDVGGRIHTSRLKERLLAALPDLQAHSQQESQGKCIILTFDEDVGSALTKACNNDDDGLHLARAAQIVRKDMFERKYSFDGSFKPSCETNLIPSSLMALVKMILDGPSIKQQSEVAATNTRASLSISQLLMFNSVKYGRSVNSSHDRHSRDRETPLTLYVAMKVHAVTRSRTLVDALFNLGMCVSYDRLLQLTNDLGNGVCDRFTLEGVVCPPKMRSGLFTVAAVDNIDYNPSAATAKDSFHGTGISLMQHCSDDFEGYNRGTLIIDQSTSGKAIAPLPQVYTSVPPAAFKTKEFKVPIINTSVRCSNFHTVSKAKEEEWNWLKAVMVSLRKYDLDKTDWISWSAYHSSMQEAVIPSPAINALLPLFLDSAHSVAMIKHSMEMVRAAVKHLNPGQVPILTLDQPLYALAKQIQWTWPTSLGEDHFVLMLGGLHIEMAILKVLGNWLEGSGWTSALVQADIASAGTADSFIKVNHVTKTRHAHQVTAACIHALLKQAYDEYTSESGVNLPLEKWCLSQAQQSLMFSYWLKALSLEILLLLYVRSIREGNFQLYVESLAKITPWMFALDHVHYSRWLPVHIRDMMALSEKHPEIAAEFHASKFVIHKTSNKFSAMAIDQCHEQNNATVKGSGGAIGLTTDPSALRRWMVAGPEVARIIVEFEDHANITQEVDKHLHHEQYCSAQQKFQKDVSSLITVFEEFGNPFLEKGQDLLVLDTRDIMDKSVGKTVQEIEAIGEDQYKVFIEERLEKCEKPITEPIIKNKLALFSRTTVKHSTRQQNQITTLKNDCSLFSRLYISCQNRDGDLDTFFAHENQATPPSLSLEGKIRPSAKSDLLHCLELCEKQLLQAPKVDAIILDGAAVVHMLHPGTARTFQDYADTVFGSYILSQLQSANRVDIVWDVYMEDSLKATTREKRGKGVRRRVASTTVLPSKWKDFLRLDENKTELFRFLSHQAIKIPVVDGKSVYATDGTNVLCSLAHTDLGNVVPCSQEEADTRIFLHASDAVSKGYRKVSVRTVDTDIVILAISMFNEMNLEELWLAFGTGSNFRYIPIHEVVVSMDPRVCATLPMFHAFTGCDTVSSFCGRGKKTAWNTWKVYPEAIDAFEEFPLMQIEISDKAMETLERFVVLLYDRTSDIMTVNDSRKYLFTQKTRSLENLPPTREVLKQHIKRARYQSICWKRALTPIQELPDPANWGWRKTSTSWEPLWSTISEASVACHELIHCGCKKGCTRRCKCVKAALKCTALCFCQGECQYDS